MVWQLFEVTFEICKPPSILHVQKVAIYESARYLHFLFCYKMNDVQSLFT